MSCGTASKIADNDGGVLGLCGKSCQAITVNARNVQELPDLKILRLSSAVRYLGAGHLVAALMSSSCLPGRRYHISLCTLLVLPYEQ